MKNHIEITGIITGDIDMINFKIFLEAAGISQAEIKTLPQEIIPGLSDACLEMKSYYIPIHFYECEPEDNELLVVTTRRNIDDAEIQKRLERIKKWKTEKADKFTGSTELVDAIFDELVYEIDGVWCYCKTLPQLVIGDS